MSMHSTVYHSLSTTILPYPLLTSLKLHTSVIFTTTFVTHYSNTCRCTHLAIKIVNIKEHTNTKTYIIGN